MSTTFFVLAACLAVAAFIRALDGHPRSLAFWTLYVLASGAAVLGADLL